MIADYINPHGKPTKQLNSIEFLLEQVVKGTYEYGEDKILQTTLPQAMIDHAIALHKQEIQEAFWHGTDGEEDKMDVLKVAEEYYKHTYIYKK